MQRNTERLQSLIIDLPNYKICFNEINQEKSASTWLSTLPLKEEGYSLSKPEFWDLAKMQIDGHSHSYQICGCGAKYDLQHSLSCKKGVCITASGNILASGNLCFRSI